MRFIHSADWQIGARFRQFGNKAAWLREVRLRTLRRSLEHAAALEVDAFLIAGDLFEDDQLESATAAQVWDILAEHPAVPVFVLPGNHDPFTGPGCIWTRPPFSQCPPNVKVFTQPEAVAVGDGWLIASPLTQKRSTVDPSRAIAEIARTLPADAVKIGMTHGSPAIESLYQPDDFPIALDAATRAGIDYLAIGHWHSEQRLDGGRLIMPGTPEPTDFAETGAGCIHDVRIDGCGKLPLLTQVRIGELRWHRWDCDIADSEFAKRRIEQFTGALADPGRSVVRVTLCGGASPDAVAAFRQWLTELLAPCAIMDVRDETVMEFSPAELLEIQQEHPLLAQVLDDLRSLSALAGGEPVLSGSERISAGELKDLCSRVGCAPEEITLPFLATAQRLLLDELRKLHRSSC